MSIQNAPIREDIQPMPPVWSMWFQSIVKAFKNILGTGAAGQVAYSDGDVLNGALNMRYDAATGVSQFGTTTDYTEFQADGSMRMVGAASVWTAMDAGLIPPHGTAATPAVIAFNGDSLLDCYAFSGTNATPDVYSSMVEMPRGYKEGSPIHIHIQWFPTDTNIGNVKWQLRYAAFNRLTVPPAAQTLSQVISTTGVAWQEFSTEFDIPGDGLKLGARIVYYLFRDATDPQDTYAHNVGVTGIGVHTEIDQIGSRQHATK